MRDEPKPLVFVDTTIFLDAYSAQNEVTYELLKNLSKHQENLILTEQVLMEFLKNRQRLICNEKLFKRDTTKLSYPAFLQTKLLDEINNDLVNIGNKLETLDKLREDMLQNPEAHDNIYNLIYRLFEKNNKNYLEIKSDNYKTIYDSATLRFKIGAPPRKSNDTALGDAINWEWVLACAESSRRNIVIVSRDTDYGHQYSAKKPVLNDYLQYEFRKRTSSGQKILLKTRLSDALEILGDPITEEQKEKESENIKLANSVEMSDFSSAAKKLKDVLIDLEKSEEFKKLRTQFELMGTIIEENFKSQNPLVRFREKI